MADLDTLLALVSLLKSDAAQLRRMVDLAKFSGAETGVRVKSPDLLVSNLDESAAAILALLDENERLRATLKSLCDGDCTYDGDRIIIQCDSHSDAITRMRLARAEIRSPPMSRRAAR